MNLAEVNGEVRGAVNHTDMKFKVNDDMNVEMKK